MAERKQVFGMSGHCRFPTRDGGSHRTCHERWVTPSSEVTCECACHLSTRQPARVAKKGSQTSFGADLDTQEAQGVGSESDRRKAASRGVNRGVGPPALA